jgi:hypothetical protein
MEDQALATKLPFRSYALTGTELLRYISHMTVAPSIGCARTVRSMPGRPKAGAVTTMPVEGKDEALTAYTRLRAQR